MGEKDFGDCTDSSLMALTARQRPTTGIFGRRFGGVNTKLGANLYIGETIWRCTHDRLGAAENDQSTPDSHQYFEIVATEILVSKDVVVSLFTGTGRDAAN